MSRLLFQWSSGQKVAKYTCKLYQQVSIHTKQKKFNMLVHIPQVRASRSNSVSPGIKFHKQSMDHLNQHAERVNLVILHIANRDLYGRIHGKQKNTITLYNSTFGVYRILSLGLSLLKEARATAAQLLATHTLI